MKEAFLKLVFAKLKTKFTDQSNPLWGQFFDDEESGYECFKDHAKNDEMFRYTTENTPFSEFQDGMDGLAERTSDRICNQINRLNYMRIHSS